MEIHRQKWIIRWIGDVILIPLGTFKPMDGRHVCPGTSTWVFDVWSIFVGITLMHKDIPRQINIKN